MLTAWRCCISSTLQTSQPEVLTLMEIVDASSGFSLTMNAILTLVPCAPAGTCEKAGAGANTSVCCGQAAPAARHSSQRAPHTLRAE